MEDFVQLEIEDVITENEVVEKATKKKKKIETVTSPSGEVFTMKEWESPVVEGGPSRAEVEEWKDKYGKIYFTPINGDVFIYRTLNRKEYRELIKDQGTSMMDREETMTDLCVLYPRNFSCEKMDKGNAGVPSILAEYIMDKSGFVAQSSPIKL